jgi:hypothetical protein
MKKTLVFVFAAILAMSMATPAFAAKKHHKHHKKHHHHAAVAQQAAPEASKR